jgi:condensin complex subunit 2
MDAGDVDYDDGDAMSHVYPMDDDDDDGQIGNTQWNQASLPPAAAVDMGSQLISGLKSLKIDSIQYAKKAKRVDVKRLKENIWDELADKVIFRPKDI